MCLGHIKFVLRLCWSRQQYIFMLSFFDQRFIVRSVWKVMPHRRYRSQAVFSWGRTCPNLCVVPWIGDCGGVWNGNLGGGLCYILFKMSNSFSTISNHIKHLTLNWVCGTQKCNSHWSSPEYVSFLWWRYWGHK